MKDLTVHFDAGELAGGREWPVRVCLDAAELTRFDLVEVTLSAREQQFALVGSGTFEARRLTRTRERSVAARLPPGVMPAGHWERTLGLHVPADWPARARSVLTHVEHVLDVRVVLPDGYTRRERFLVAAPAAPSAASLDRQRRLEVWSEAVRRMQSAGVSEMRFDPAREEARFAVGCVRAHVHPHLVTSLGPCLRAVLEWPSVGLGLYVGERFASDPPQATPGLDAALCERFVLNARNGAQATHFFDAALGHALAAFDRATLDDALAIGISRGSVQHPTDTTRFLLRTYELAKRIYRGLETALAPPALAATLAAYRRFAARTGATLHVGDLSLSAWRVRDAELSVQHRFDAVPAYSVLWLERPLGSDAAKWAHQLEESTGRAAQTGPHRSGVSLPLLADPAAAEETAGQLARAMTKLLGPVSTSPYR